MKENKYLENKIGLINASIAGHCIGVAWSAKEHGTDYHYDHGKNIRALIEKDIRQLFNYAYKLGKKSNE